MELWHVIRTDPIDYDEYDSWVVAAKDAEQAVKFCGYQKVTVTLIGTAVDDTGAGVVLGSFNAG